MSNEELFQKLEDEFTKEQLRIFCIVNVLKYNILYEDFKKGHPHTPSEFEYEMNWYLSKYKELKQNGKD